ncbi:hypothetical protein [Gordonia sp. GN26]
MSEPRLPAAYVDVLREMARDPSRTMIVREVVGELNSPAIADLIFPMPTEWSSTDYELFHADERVRYAEFERRVELAVDEWMLTYRGYGNGPDLQGRRDLEEWTREQFLNEIRHWKATQA